LPSGEIAALFSEPSKLVNRVNRAFAIGFSVQRRCAAPAHQPGAHQAYDANHSDSHPVEVPLVRSRTRVQARQRFCRQRMQEAAQVEREIGDMMIAILRALSLASFCRETADNTEFNGN